MNKKYIIITIVSVLILSIGASLAYWTATLRGEGTPMSFSSGEARVIFDKKEDGSITSDTPIEPGWSVTKTFSVKSESDTTFKYNIIIKDCINTFKTTGFLQYKITSTNGYNMTDYQDIPKSENASDKPLAKEISLEPNATHDYTIEFRYIETDEDQSDDMGATLSGTLFIEEFYDINGKPLYEVLTNGKVYKLGERGSFDTPFGGEAIQDGYNQEKTIYKVDDNNYYFAGNPSDNWVLFAGKYWRIIRTEKGVGTRLLYAGSSAEGQDGFINNTDYVWNSSYDNYEYVYWSNSSFNSTLNSWYSSNIIGRNDNMVETIVYCNDTTTLNTSIPYYYGAYNRLVDAKKPSHSCEANQFGSASKVGMMTADEVAYAGGVYEKKAPNTYYYRNSKTSGCTGNSNDSCSVTGNHFWWTMSPNRFDVGRARVFSVNGAGSNPGYLGNDWVNYSRAVRPVVTLKSSVLVFGSGTAEDPFIPILEL